MLKIYIKICLLILVIFSSANELFAGGDKRNGTAGAQELLIPVGARGLALNGTNIADVEGIEAIYYNPAGLGFSKNSAQVMFSQMNYIADIGVSYAALAANFGSFGSLAFSIKSVDFGDIPVTTVEAPEGTGSHFSPTFVTLGVTYSNALTDRIRVGVNVKLISEKIIRTSSTGVAFDAGVQYSGIANISGLKLGVVLKNLGPPMKFDGPDLLRRADDVSASRGEQFYKIDAAGFELPSQLELGLAYERTFMGSYKAIISTAYQNNNFANDEYKIGAEFNFNDFFYLRGGYSISEETNVDENIFGPTFGAGINFKAGLDFTFDYAYRWARYFDANHVFAIKIGF
ncbi:MAG: PorV/PorQ family protein [Bacteroidetes bacterium]|nr:PorV/PorQ family protein [Bacteroidota bacterium]MBU2586079.1 PorV/PorQ family protein [Bacteroidota bacterium]